MNTELFTQHPAERERERERERFKAVNTNTHTHTDISQVSVNVNVLFVRNVTLHNNYIYNILTTYYKNCFFHNKNK
jgi:hypothetical protein